MKHRSAAIYNNILITDAIKEEEKRLRQQTKSYYNSKYKKNFRSHSPESLRSVEEKDGFPGYGCSQSARTPVKVARIIDHDLEEKNE